VESFKVCVVDDCVDEATLLCEGLKLHGYETVMVHTGREALERAGQGDLNLMLLDVGLPDIDGYEVCDRLKLSPVTRDLPIIFVTAKGAADDVSHGYELGAVDYIAKPYNLPMVMMRVDTAMSSRDSAEINSLNPRFYQDRIYTDTLTGLRNHRFLIERLQEEVEKAHRYGHPVSCVVLNVDEVTPLENETGSPEWNDLLVEVALALRNASRNYDILARCDGERFAAVLPHASVEDAIKYANKLGDELEGLTYACPTQPVQARMRFGVVTCRNGSTIPGDKMFSAALQQLLLAEVQSKRVAARDLSEHSQGRN